MDVLGGTGRVELNLFRTQTDEERTVNALASGLRVVSASDDPSGLAIASTLQSSVAGLQQGSQNVQLANTLLQAADATLSNVESILQRIHSLIVQSASDVNSQDDLKSIQTEIDGLMVQINKISAGTQFNGVKLFDGSLATYRSSFDESAGVVQVAPFDSTNTGPNVYDATNTGSSNPGPLIYNAYYQQGGFVPGLTEFQVIGSSPNPTDPISGPLGAPGVYLKITQYSTDPAFDSTQNATEQISVGALPTNVGQNAGAGPGNPLYINTPDNLNSMLRFEIANLSPQDVGTAMAFETFNPAPAPTGQALQVNTNGTEGGVVEISLPNLSVSALGISEINVEQPTIVDYLNNVTGTGSNAAAAADAEARVNNALDAITGVRAQVDTQSYSLNVEANNSSMEAMNLTSSESSIRDANIGAESSNLVKDQVLTNIDVSVISQMQLDANLVAQLVARAASLPPLHGLRG